MIRSHTVLSMTCNNVFLLFYFEIKKIFDVKSDFEISESYSEFWATVLNSCFISYNLLDDTDDIDTFLLFTDFCIQLERIFSLFQMIKLFILWD